MEVPAPAKATIPAASQSTVAVTSRLDLPDVEVGVTFLVDGPYDDVGNQDAVQAAQIRANTIDEIIRATKGAHNEMMDIEKLTDEDLERIQKKYGLLAEKTKEDLRDGKLDTHTPDIGKT